VKWFWTLGFVGFRKGLAKAMDVVFVLLAAISEKFYLKQY
jgi:hypothetical protein